MTNIQRRLRTESSIFHLVFCRARMNSETIDMYVGLCCIEVFIFKLSDISAVHRKCKVCTEAFNIKEVCPVASLLIRSEAYADISIINKALNV